MGLIRTIAALPHHLKILMIAIIALVGAWMLITPIYLEILSWSEGMPMLGWMIIGICLILFAGKFGKAVL